MDAQRFRTGFDSEPLYSKLYNPRWPHTQAEYTLEMDVEVERLRMEILLSQPAPLLQCGSSPRRSLAIGMRLDEPGAPHAESQSTEEEGIFPLQASLKGFLHVCTSPEQESTFLFQVDVGINDEETTITNAQAIAHKEFARPPKNRQQQRVTAWGAEQIKQLDPGG